MTREAAVDALLTEQFFGELVALKRQFGWLLSARDSGVLPARQHGESAEFFEHRPYLPGDDVRHVDWLASARSGWPMLKRYRAEQAGWVRLLIDPSRSMDVGNPSKWRSAQRLAAALAYLSLGSGHQCQLLTVERESVRARPPARSARHLARLVQAIVAAPRTVDTQLDRWLRHVDRSLRARGTLVVISDFLSSAPPLEACSALWRRGHQLVLAQLVDTSDLEPELGELPLTLKDSETHALLDLEVTEALLDAYHAALRATIDPLGAWARQHDGVHVVLSTRQSLPEQIHALITRSSIPHAT